jgi:tetratricopeptide (TPR) repeat protein
MTLTACTTRLPPLPEDPRHELTSVPFFPQTIHQCGPAALATVLGATGVAITPEQLAPLVYIPDRRGSLQVEMLAAARTQRRITYVLEPQFADLQSELAAGNPVLVLQDLGALGIRRWHFAVVVGYDPQRDVLILRSGTERRQLEHRDRFLQTWQASDYWAAVITRPDQPPATATGSSFIRALSAAESHLSGQSVEAANAAALARWPADPLVLLANGNQAYAAGQLATAITRYRSLVAIDPNHLAGRNNLANALLDAGCPQLAIQEARQASALVSPDSPLAAAVQDTLAKATAADATAGANSTCRAE